VFAGDFQKKNGLANETVEKVQKCRRGEEKKPASESAEHFCGGRGLFSDVQMEITKRMKKANRKKPLGGPQKSRTGCQRSRRRIAAIIRGVNH